MERLGLAQAVVFDMDGLLCDSEATYRDAMSEAANRLGHTMPPELFLSMVGLPSPQAQGMLVDHFGPDFPLPAFNTHLRAAVDAAHEGGAPLKPGAVELLDLLDELGLLRAICTSSSHGTVLAHLGGSGILARVDTVVARGDYDQPKPHPAPYLTAAARLGVERGVCLALEDSPNGVRSAAAAGLITVMVPDLLPATDELRRLCVTVASDLHAICELLRTSTETR